MKHNTFQMGNAAVAGAGKNHSVLEIAARALMTESFGTSSTSRTYPKVWQATNLSIYSFNPHLQQAASRWPWRFWGTGPAEPACSAIRLMGDARDENGRLRSCEIKSNRPLNTMPEGTLKAFADHGDLGSMMAPDGGNCEAVLAEFAKAGINVDALAAQLRDEGAKSFVKSGIELAPLQDQQVRVRNLSMSVDPYMVAGFEALLKGEQRKRFLQRIDEPDKNWKFSLADIHERKYWTQYTKATAFCNRASA